MIGLKNQCNRLLDIIYRSRDNPSVPYFTEGTYLLGMGIIFMVDADGNSISRLMGDTAAITAGIPFIAFGLIMMYYKPRLNYYIALMSIRILYIGIVIARFFISPSINLLVILVYSFSVIHSILLFTAHVPRMTKRARGD